jgi:hypothetical protein
MISGLNRLKLGKCYENPRTGEQLYVCGIADTLAFGNTLMAEVGSSVYTDTSHLNFQPIDLYDQLKSNGEVNRRWIEIPLARFELCNYHQMPNNVSILKSKIKSFERRKKIEDIIKKSTK